MRITNIILTLLIAGPTQATGYYISPDGSDAALGTETAPWLTWNHALAQLNAGDTLYVKDGTWTPSSCAASDPKPCVVSPLPLLNCDGNEPSWTQANNGTSGAPITIIAKNERIPLLRNNGQQSSFNMKGCDYWVISGLRTQGVDYDGGGAAHNFELNDTNHVTIKRNLAQYNNRYQNSHLYSVSNSRNIVFEENEGYDFHRHGISISNSSNARVTRNYLNSRSRADLTPPGTGYDSHDEATDRGDECISLYFTDNSLLENNIAESCEGHSSTGWNNTLLGNMSNDVVYGVTIVSNCEDPVASQECDTAGDRHANNNAVKNQLVINASYHGIYCKTCGGRFENVTIIGANYGFLVRDQVEMAGYTTSAWLRYWHVQDAGTRAYEYINNVTIQHYGGEYMNQWNGGVSPWLPNTDNWQKKYNVDPKLDGCYVLPPSASGLRLAGGEVMGAEVVYQYENGRLTEAPLWLNIAVLNAQFDYVEAPGRRFAGCGNVIDGVNDTKATSCIGAHVRFGVDSCVGLP